jgi:hypothetical protein
MRILKRRKRPAPSAPTRKRARRPDPVERAIAKRIAAGEEPEAFLCIDCYCWSEDPVFCGCWARAVFPAE